MFVDGQIGYLEGRAFDPWDAKIVYEATHEPVIECNVLGVLVIAVFKIVLMGTPDIFKIIKVLDDVLKIICDRRVNTAILQILAEFFLILWRGQDGDGLFEIHLLPDDFYDRTLLFDPVFGDDWCQIPGDDCPRIKLAPTLVAALKAGLDRGRVLVSDKR